MSLQDQIELYMKKYYKSISNKENFKIISNSMNEENFDLDVIWVVYELENRGMHYQLKLDKKRFNSFINSLNE